MGASRRPRPSGPGRHALASDTEQRSYRIREDYRACPLSGVRRLGKKPAEVRPVDCDALAHRLVLEPRWLIDTELRAQTHDLWDVPPHVHVAAKREPDHVPFSRVQ